MLLEHYVSRKSDMPMQQNNFLICLFCDFLSKTFGKNKSTKSWHANSLIFSSIICKTLMKHHNIWNNIGAIMMCYILNDWADNWHNKKTHENHHYQMYYNQWHSISIHKYNQQAQMQNDKTGNEHNIKWIQTRISFRIVFFFCKNSTMKITWLIEYFYHQKRSCSLNLIWYSGYGCWSL